jgi:hypothetical protein
MQVPLTLFNNLERDTALPYRALFSAAYRRIIKPDL